jgi:benzoyl-CoA reductase/2-hydroxyglutaryl-CoA dehydratase subunit BcrC/BadD/HgdB
VRDLKYLYYFEGLLEDANNALVQQASQEGKHPIGYTCFHMPEVLLNIDSCFSVRMRAPKTGSMDVATFYMSNYVCEYCRALLERAIEGGYAFLDAWAGVDACAQMNRCIENMEIQKSNSKPGFFISHIDVPYKVDEYAVKHYASQIRLNVLDRLHKNYGVDTSDAMIRKAVELHNEVAEIITEIGEFRRENNPKITGYEFHILNLISYCCPKALIVEKLRETLEEIRNRIPDEKSRFRARVVLAGSEIDDPELTKIIEDAGALIVADRFCFGSFPGRQKIELSQDEDPLIQICRQYLKDSQCPRFMTSEKIQQRYDSVDGYAKHFNADGIIYEQIKFCDYWGYERALASHVMNAEFGYPVLSIDRPYNSKSSAGQLLTRVQAFIERIEIKKIQNSGEKK